jgi:hypothetical protein
VRLAVHHESEVAVRAGQILLAERGLVRLGLVDRTPRKSGDERVVRADDVGDFDVVVSDTEEPATLIGRALGGGTSLCLWRDVDVADHHEDFAGAGLTLLTGANLATGIAPALAAHETALAGTVMDVTIAWTEPGRPLRRGEALVFPDPVGARWGVARPSERGRAFAAPIGGEWAGAMARVTSAHEDGVMTRVVGVADLAPHLEALALAAGALAVAGGAFPPGTASPVEGAEAYLAAALRAGLDVAAFSIPGT